MLKKYLHLFSILFCTFLIGSCDKKKTLFERLPANETGITFANRITTNDTLNIITTEYVYNGGGVGIGDFNNDGLQDIFFSGNQVGNELYLNEGDFKFKNVSEKAGITGKTRWNSGVSIVDINSDGRMDIYVSATIYKTADKRKNQLFVNQGVSNGVPVFKEMADAYGIADDGHGEHAAFFDYDNDGDLDLYVLIDVIDQNPNLFRQKITDGSYPNTDRLYRNDYSESLGHPVFTNVSTEAGITIEGFGLGLTVCDINQDGWKDIYVTNDYAADDLLYINNQDGTFTDQAARYFKHSSNSAMGNDIADINNDGLPDVVALDMQPGNNLRKKLLASPNNYYMYQFTEKFGYVHQYVRNTLQLNNSLTASGPKSPFSEIGLMAGVAQTDWSWCPSLADFDNDGYRDLLITNGFPKDVTDRDFMAFRQGISNIASPSYLMDKIPEVKISNYGFKNKGDLTFEDVTEAWGLEIPSFSNGAAFADLDNDGDLDYVVNNINDSAFVYKNTLREKQPENANYLRIKFEGGKKNPSGYGAMVKGKFTNGQSFFAENMPVRGYLSSVEPFIHLGLGTQKQVKELTVIWQNGKSQRFTDVKSNQVLLVKQSDATAEYNFSIPQNQQLFAEAEINFQHVERDYVDYTIQNLLPQKLSQMGPSLSVGDVNNDGLEDIYVGGPKFKIGSLLLLKPNGSYANIPLQPKLDSTQKLNEEIGSLLFDADKDGDLDLYIVNGGNEDQVGSESLQDQLFVNDGNGNFSLSIGSLPRFLTAGSCVRADDFDNDGDLDLFIGGRNTPSQYPKATSSTLLRNDSKPGVVKFTDVTKTANPALINFGMVTDALWTDVDNDGDRDLMIVGDFTAIHIFKNNKGRFTEFTSTGLTDIFGMWSSLNSGDFDGDGDIDYIAGNVGLNALFKGNKEFPAKLLSADFDNNGNYDVLPFIYLPTSDRDKATKLVPFNSQDDINKQLIPLKGRFTTYNAYSEATFDNLLADEMRKNAVEHTLNFNASVYIENLGNGKFNYKPLPNMAQIAPLKGMVIDDFNQDGKIDVLIVGNNYGNELSVGRYDAMNGLLLTGNGKGNFAPMTTTGFNVPGDAKALVRTITPEGNLFIIASQNRGAAKLYKTLVSGKIIIPKLTDSRVMYKLNGKQYVHELYYGASYLSQSSRKVIIPKDATDVGLR